MEYKFEIFKDTEMNEETFDNWREYRIAIRNKMSQELEDEAQSLVIFGAGGCNDIDLKYWESKFEKITLVDINKKSMVNAIEKHGLLSSGKINMKEVDFIGIADDVYKEYEDMLIKKESVKKICKYIRNITNDIEIKNIDLIIDEHEVAICLGVHSQLTITFEGILSFYIESYSRKDILKIKEEIHYMNLKVAKRLNNEVFKYSTKKVFIGFDIMEISIELGTDKYLEKINELILKRDFIGLQNNIVNKFSVTGSLEGNEDVRRRVIKKDIKLECFNTLYWPFNNEKIYLVYMYTLSKI